MSHLHTEAACHSDHSYAVLYFEGSLPTYHADKDLPNYNGGHELDIEKLDLYECLSKEDDTATCHSYRKFMGMLPC